jgi:hypothetical protein
MTCIAAPPFAKKCIVRRRGGRTRSTDGHRHGGSSYQPAESKDQRPHCYYTARTMTRAAIHPAPIDPATLGGAVDGGGGRAGVAMGAA